MINIYKLGNLKILKYHYDKLDHDAKKDFHDEKNMSTLLKEIINSDSTDVFEWILNNFNVTNILLLDSCADDKLKYNILNYILDNNIRPEIHDKLINTKNISGIKSIPILKKHLQNHGPDEEIIDNIWPNCFRVAYEYYMLYPSWDMLHYLQEFQNDVTDTEMCELLNKLDNLPKNTVTHKQICECMRRINIKYYPTIFSHKPDGDVPYDLYLKYGVTEKLLLFLLDQADYDENIIEILLKYFFMIITWCILWKIYQINFQHKIN